MKWNPNNADNCVSGLEWAPTREVSRMVSGVGDASASWLVESTVTENIDRLYTFSGRAVPSAPDVIDIYDVNDLAPVRATTEAYPYTSDAVAGRFVRPTGGLYFGSPAETTGVIQSVMTAQSRDWYSLLDATPTAGLYRGRIDILTSSFFAFDEAVPIVNQDFVGLVAILSAIDPAGGDYSSSFSQWAFHVDGLTTNTTGKRILGLTVACDCQRLVDPRVRSSEFDQPYRIRPALLVGSRNYFGQAQIMPSTAQRVEYTWFTNPATGLAWTEAELDDFDSTAEVNAVAWLMSRPDDPAVRQSTAGAIYNAWAEVTYVDETRVAEATRTATQQFVGWNEWQVSAVGGGDWAKDASESYLMNQRVNVQQAVDWRPVLSSEGLSTRMLGDGFGVPDNVTEVAVSFIGEVPRSVGDPTGFVPGVLLREPVGGGGDVSVDSQPYVTVQDAAELGLVRNPGQPVVAQNVVFDSNDPPTFARFVARSENDQTPECELVVTVRDDNDVLEVTGASPVTGDMLVTPGGWQEFQVELGAPSWEFGSAFHVIYLTATGTGVGWQVLALTDGIAQPGVQVYDLTAGDATYDDIAAQAFGGDPAGFRPDADVPVVLGIPPEEPDNLAVTYDDTDPYGPCFVVEWDGQDTNVDCNVLTGYEVQRESVLPNGQTVGWQTVFMVLTDGTETDYEVRDWEAPRNATVSYRVRSLGVTGFMSDWCADESDDSDDNRCGYWFTTNVHPELNLWADDIGARSYGFTERQTFFEFEGRDGQEQVRGLTDLLDRFEIELLLAGLGATSPTGTPIAAGGPGRDVFDALTVLAGNKRDTTTGVLYRLPYVCVLDQHGGSWFAGLETPSGINREPSGQYTARVIVTELTRTPFAGPTEYEVPGS